MQKNNMIWYFEVIVRVCKQKQIWQCRLDSTGVTQATFCDPWEFFPKQILFFFFPNAWSVFLKSCEWNLAVGTSLGWYIERPSSCQLILICAKKISTSKKDIQGNETPATSLVSAPLYLTLWPDHSL